MTSWLMNKGYLKIPRRDEIGSFIRIDLAGHEKPFMISHESNFKVMFRALPPGEYPIEVEGEFVEEDKHFPNPMVSFPAIKITKLNFVSKKD